MILVAYALNPCAVKLKSVSSKQPGTPQTEAFTLKTLNPLILGPRAYEGSGLGFSRVRVP